MLSHSWAFRLSQRLLFSCAILTATSVVSAQGNPPDWRALWGQANEAHQKKDYPAYRDAMYSLFEAVNGHPEAIFGMAKGEALTGNRREAIRWLHAYARTGLYKDIAAEQDFSSLRDDPEFKTILQRMETNRETIAKSQTWLELPDDLIPEDIACDQESGRFFVTSMRHRKMMWIDSDKRTGTWLMEGQDGLWAVMAVGVDRKRNAVWVTTEAIPHALSYSEADKNRSALLAYSLRDRRLLKRLEVPDRESPHELGDLTIAPDGAVFVSDGKAGRLYRATLESKELELVSAELASPQGPTLSARGDTLYVADYVLGIMVVDLKTKRVTPLQHPLHIPLNGIDCLILRGRQLIAIQNGTDPIRVLLLDLDITGTKVVGSRVLEASPAALGSPTHGVVRGKRFYYLANTGLDNFDQNGQLAPGKKLSPSRIVYVELEQP